jgi:hypothetical protein
MAVKKKPGGREQIAAYFKQFDDLQRQTFKTAFTDLLDLPASKQKHILPELIQYFNRSSSPSKEVSQKCEITDEALAAFILAQSLASFVRADETDDAIIEGLQEALALPADVLSAVRTLLTLLREDRDTLDKLRNRQNLAAETMPAFETIQISTDIRLKIEDGEITDRVPVVIATIFSDAPNGFFSFQMSKEDLTELKLATEKALKGLALASAWIDSSTGSIEEK